MPISASGGIQPDACERAYLNGTLVSWDGQPIAPLTNNRVRVWLREQVASILQSPAIKDDEPFSNYGLRPRQLITRLEQWLKRRCMPTMLYDYPTIDLLAEHLVPQHEARSQLSPSLLPPTEPGEPIAIVGIGCRFPGGANSPTAFWQLLQDGVDAITEVPADRWDVQERFNTDRSVPGAVVTRWGGFLDDIDQFDNGFFGISPREAACMDPQQRILLETAWEAFEDAGIPVDQLAGSQTGVFVGSWLSDYGQSQLGMLDQIDTYVGTGSVLSLLANRLSYAFDFHGPSMVTDTACSSSLVALHLACQSIRTGESSIALAGGSNLLLSPAFAINFSKARVLSPDGRCKTFDARADGYVRSEGVGLVVLKRLSQALADDDRIYAVIRGGVVHQDGLTNGIMAPNRHAQEAMLRLAYHRAGIAPEDVNYIEAHGTGTFLGDPIETMALGAVLGANRNEHAPCLIGSVKTNIGHLEGAAGVAGLIKVALMLYHRELVPSLHFETPNPHIPFEELALEVVQEHRAWQSNHPLRTAGVSSFGFGGTIAHMVLQEAPVANTLNASDTEPDEPPYLLPLSARSPQAL
ncbi:MAG: type I polyketide synthase, partial [Chloroflexaceae bacterium]|nr:type I polyketide synthase [Chloroflexaceae bacterium]